MRESALREPYDTPSYTLNLIITVYLLTGGILVSMVDADGSVRTSIREVSLLDEKDRVSCVLYAGKSNSIALIETAFDAILVLSVLFSLFHRIVKNLCCP